MLNIHCFINCFLLYQNTSPSFLYQTELICQNKPNGDIFIYKMFDRVEKNKTSVHQFI